MARGERRPRPPTPPRPASERARASSSSRRARARCRRSCTRRLRRDHAPEGVGRAGPTTRHQQIFDEEVFGYERPGGFGGTFGPILGALLGHMNDEQRSEYLVPILRGTLWCQLMSEPGAGSDVAGITTRAVQDGDEWVINGQKVWTTAGHLSDMAMCIARTDWDVPKHSGLTMFIVPMDTPGVSPRPLRQITGERSSARRSSTTCACRPATCSVNRAAVGRSCRPGSPTSTAESRRVTSPAAASVAPRCPLRLSTARVPEGPRRRERRARSHRRPARARPPGPNVHRRRGERHGRPAPRYRDARRPDLGSRGLDGQGRGHGPRRNDSTEAGVDLAGMAGVAWDPDDPNGDARRPGDAAEPELLDCRWYERDPAQQRRRSGARLAREPAVDRGIPFREVRTNAVPPRERDNAG